MPKLDRERMREAVERQLPGQTLADERTDARRARTPAQSGTPDMSAIKRKYARGPGAADALKRAKRRTLRDDDDIVLVRPKDPADAVSRGSRPKAVVVDKTGRIIGRQG